MPETGFCIHALNAVYIKSLNRWIRLDARGNKEDIEELVRTRIIVLRAANKLSDDVAMPVVEKKSYAYYRRALENGEHTAYLIYDNGTFVGAGGVSFYQVMPTYHNSTGKRCEETGRVTDCLRGNGYGTAIV